MTVVIQRAEIQNLYNPRTKRSERRFVLSFEGKDLKMVLNKTQCMAIVALSGEDDSDGWSGLAVELSPARAPNGRPTIRIGPAPESAGGAPASGGEI